jgi:mRNA interferase MazF
MARSVRATRAKEPSLPTWGGSPRRGDLFRVRAPEGDPKRSRVFVVVSRPEFLRARFSSAVCAPVHSQRGGLSTEVDIGPAEGVKHPSSIQCDALTSLRRSMLTDYVGSLGPPKLAELKRALRIALAIE